MNLVTRSARKAARDYSLTVFKARAHRANRSSIKRAMAEILGGSLDADDADFMPKRSHLVTAWEVD